MSGPAGGSGGGPRPRESADRCALQAQLRGDPMAGSALATSRLLLVEQPGPWGPRGLVDSRADPVLADRVDHLAAAGGARMQAIRRPGRHPRPAPGDTRAVGLVDVRAATSWWWRVASLDELVAQLEGAGEGLVPPGAVADRDPAYLVCTHSKHDACCALRGRPVAQALAEVRPDRVWETTHVGGDRFAANVLVVPTGQLYGRVLPFAAADLVAHTEAGEVVWQILRGRLGLAPVAQAALVHAHAVLAEPRVSALAVRGSERLEADVTLVRLDTPGGEVTVRVESTWADPERLTCRGAAPARARVHRCELLDGWRGEKQSYDADAG